MKKPSILFAFVAAMIAAQIAVAEIRWDASGFATFGIGKTNRDDLLFMDYDGDWSVDSDTMVGLQLVLEPIDRLSVTGQLVTRGHSFDDVAEYATEVEWFFLSYDFSENARLRAGRLRTPYQYYSESLEVGYSYVWARPPPNVYAFLFEPFSHFDGVDFTYTFYGDDVDTEIKLVYGTQEGTFTFTDVDIAQMTGFTVASRWQDLTLRYGFLEHKVNLSVSSFTPIEQALQQAAEVFTGVGLPDPGFASLTELYALRDGRMGYHSLGAEWRPDQWSITVERYELTRPEKQLDLSSRGWYLSIARQFDQLTPYVVVGGYKSAMGKDAYQQIEQAFIAAEAYYEPLPPPLALLRTSAEFALDLYVVGQRSYTAGMRWDFHSQMALKTEIEYTEFTRGSTGHYIGKTIAADKRQDPNDALSFTLVLDVVF